MATVTEVREAFATFLTANVPGLHAPASGGKIHTPGALIMPSRGDPHDASFSEQLWTFDILVFASLNDLASAEAHLDAYLSPGTGVSIQDALEADPTLDGAIQDLTVTEWRDYGYHPVSGTMYLGVIIEVEVRP